MFRYPTGRIKNVLTDYDTYWKDKRATNLGSLSPWQKKRAKLALSFFGSESSSVVDVGSGDGSVLKYLKEHGNISRGTAVDISPLVLEKAREFGLDTVQVDINDLSKLGDIPRADYILLFEILEHIQDSELFLAAMYAKASRGVLFSFPNTGYFAHRFRLLFGRFPMQWRVHPREHVRFWTYTDLQWWLNALGYTTYHIEMYEGVPVLNRLWPALFAAGSFVYLPKQ